MSGDAQLKTLDELINSRRSIRKYLEKAVEKEKIEQALESARMAPSACNAQPWRFVVTTGTKKNKIINDGLGGLIVSNSWTKTVPVIVVVCSVSSLFTHKVGENIQGTQYHLMDLGISMEHFVLKATELGLGTCYIGWFNGKRIGKLLNIPSSWKPECLITVGYPDENPEPRPRKPAEEIFKFEE
ncbi:MAG: nitroreductase family protein [Elusimicrobiota bacterium]